MQLLKHFKEISLHPENAMELKGLILQLAVQGKLTAQWRIENSDVEPAEKLLERIKEEKERHVKENKIKKEKLIPPIIKDELPYKLPYGWVWCRLGDISNYGSSNKVESKNVDENTWVLELEDVEKGSSKLLQKVRYSERKFKSTKSVFSKGDVIYGKLRPYLDKVVVADEAGVCTTEMIPIKPYGNILSEYIRWFLKSPDFIQYANSSTHGMRMPRLGTDKAKSAIISLPPLPDQKAIIKVVEQLFKEVEQLEALTEERIQLKEKFATSALKQLTINNTVKEWEYLQPHFHTFFNEEPNIKKLRETILQLAVQGKLTAHWRTSSPVVAPAEQLLERIKEEKERLVKEKKIKKEKPLPPITKEEIPYELPEGWVWCRITELVDVGTGSTPAKSDVSYYINGTIPWYTSSATNLLYAAKAKTNITDKALKETNCKIFPSGSLIIAMYGQGKTRGQISEIVEAGATNQAIAAMVFFESSKVVKPYLKYYFQKIYHEIRLLAEGGAQPNLNVGKVKSTFIPFPPLLEQKAIVEKVNSLMALCDSLEQAVKQSKVEVEKLMKGVLREVVGKDRD